MLSLAAAHLDYLVPGKPQYHRAKYALLNKALHDYREALSAPITADNCDPLLGTANLIHFLMWCDLSFMDDSQTAGSSSSQQPPPLDLSGDRLYWLSTGIRQIFFMAWPLFQTTQSVFMHVGMLQPCMVLEEVVDARGLNWQRFLRAFMDLYDNPRYQGGRNNNNTTSTAPETSCPSTTGSSQETTPPMSSPSTTPSLSPSPSPNGSSTNTAYLEGLFPSFPSLPFPSSAAAPFKVMTLYESYKEGEAYVQRAGAHDERLMRAAYKRIAARLAVAMAFIADDGGPAAASEVARDEGGGEGGGGCSQQQQQQPGPTLKTSDIVRYVSVFPMMCFGPLLALISSGDSRMLVVLYHIYRAVDALLPGETHWWCKRRGVAMKEAIGRELGYRGLEVCLRRQGELT